MPEEIERVGRRRAATHGRREVAVQRISEWYFDLAAGRAIRIDFEETVFGNTTSFRIRSHGKEENEETILGGHLKAWLGRDHSGSPLSSDDQTAPGHHLAGAHNGVVQSM